MERVAFLLEDTGEQLGCLLNPETLAMRRRAGVEPRHSAGGLVTGSELADDPLVFTGGGRTELDLDLLFDISLAGSSIATEDVRQLTGPIWDLAENRHRLRTYGRPPLVRFVWGKSWNIPGIVTAVSERLEHFTAGGAPTRSWLRMRLLRVADARSATPNPSPAGRGETVPDPYLTGWGLETLELAAERAEAHEIQGIGEGDDGAGAFVERLDQIAYMSYGDASQWRLLASFNGLFDPLRLTCGWILQIPPLTDLGPGP